MSGLVSVNGVISKLEDAKLSVLDRGFLFGDQVFEVMVGFRKHILDLSRHVSRLRQSAAMVRMNIPWSDEEIKFEVEALVEQVAFPKSYIRLVVTRGEGLGLRYSESLAPTKITYCLEAPRALPHAYTEGLGLKIVIKGSNPKGPAAKTGNYLPAIMALNEAKSYGYDEILWSDEHGDLMEASTANIFFVAREGDLVEVATPPSNAGLLLGITRHRVIDLLQSAGIPVTERIVNRDELARFDEAFLTSTVMGLVPINRIDSHKLHTMRANSVFRHFSRLYLTWVETELGYRPNWETGLERS